MNPSTIGLYLVAILLKQKTFMKTTIGILMLAGFTVAAFNGADAQRRGHDSGGWSGRESNTGGRSFNTRSFSEGRSFNPGNSFHQNNTARVPSFRQNNFFHQNNSTPVQRNQRIFTQRNTLTDNSPF